MAVPATLTETQAIQHLIAAKGSAGAKAAAAAGLDREAIREVLTAKAAAAKVGTTGAVAGGVPIGVEPDIFRQAAAAKANAVGATKAVAGAKTGTAAAKIGMTGLEPDILREAVLSKAIGGTGAAAGTTVAGGSSVAAEAVTTGSLWSGKGFGLGLGLGLGIWGPILVVAAGAAATYAYLQYRKGLLGATDEQIAETPPDEGFYPNKA